VSFPHAGHLVGRKFAFSIWMEFMGLMLFSLFGNSVTPEFAPAGNGEEQQGLLNNTMSWKLTGVKVEHRREEAQHRR
jgi:glycerol uptake facilitator-like aquaporin